MENLNERAKRIINTKNDFLKPHEVFTFVTYNNVKLDAVCIHSVNHIYIDKLHLVDYTYLCYSQNRLFYIHQQQDLAVKEFVIKDFNQIVVDYCIIPEYDRMLAEVAE